ncbi:MAG: EAL domain-containing protein [Sulfuriferula sp.]|nr:EAL domain-containing protein [Sulfuriferula sp.]
MPEQTRAPAFGSDLPTKISGIVFWGTVLIGLLIAFMVLKNKEDELAVQYRNNARILQTVIAKSLEYSSDAQFSDTTRRDLERNLQPFRNIINCNAIEVSRGSTHFIFGEKKSGLDAITAQLRIRPIQPGLAPFSVQTAIYFPSLRQVLATYRKLILLSIALLMMVFGLILQLILQRLLTRPFAAMVTTAQKFADGDNNIRFDDRRTDEFGFLAKFINRALDSSAKHHEQLTNALTRVTASELALFAEKERIEVTLSSLSEAVITTDANAIVEYLNPVAEKMTGWTHLEARGQPLDCVISIVDEMTLATMPTPVHTCLESGTTAMLEENAALSLRNGQTIAIEASAAPMRNTHGEIIGTVMVCLDVSHARKLASQLSHQASHDTLTSLYNRCAFESQLNRLLADITANTSHTLLYVDLDQFKIVNDTCGHTAGDELLRQLAQVLQECVRRNDVLARLGGDEFGILLVNCDLQRATEVAEKVRHAVKEFRFAWLESVFEIGASIGMVEINADNVNPAIIMSSADLACYAAKDGGRNRVHIYKKTDDDLLQRHGEMHWTTMITQALELNRFVLFHQPICELAGNTSAVHHWEILVRMRAEDGTIIQPGQFIAAAERYNKMHSIDRWVIYNTFAAIAHGCFPIPDNGRRMLSINLSGATLGDETALQFIRETGRQFAIDYHEICFEITETVAISNLSKATAFIKALKKLGCSFSLDDFGSGLSSFGYLKNLPVDFIKIDGSFVKDMASAPIDCAMVTAIHQIGHVMQIQTIAEWVEEETTLTLLTQIGIDYAQGYYLGKPSPVAFTPAHAATGINNAEQ